MPFDPATRSPRLSPRDPAFFSNPYAAYARLHAAPGPWFSQDYGFWLLAGHAEVSAALRDKRLGRQILHVATRAELGWPERPAHLAAFDAIERHSLLELEPPDHTRLRALVNRAFVSRQVERLAPSIADIAERALDRLSPGDDLLEGFATPIPVAVIAALIGAPAEDAALLLDWSHRMVALYQFAPGRTEEDFADAAARDFTAYVRDLIAARRANPRDDLVSRLIEGGLPEGELVSTVVLLLNAGHEATVHSLGNAIKTLIEHGAAYDGSEAATEELLRFDPPLHLFTRYALEDVEITGARLKKGEQIGLLLGAANRDPLVFADPDQLDLTRTPNPHVAFGGGIHFCLGAPLARLEMRVALPILFRRLPGLALAEPPQWRDAYHFHGLTALKVRWRSTA